MKSEAIYVLFIVYLENAWTSKQMITEGEAASAIPLETTRRAFRNQSQSKQRSALVDFFDFLKFFIKAFPSAYFFQYFEKWHVFENVWFQHVKTSIWFF